MKRIIFAFCILAGVIAFALLAYSAEPMATEDSLKYEVRTSSLASGSSLTIFLGNHWVSISIFAPDQAMVNFSSTAYEEGIMPLNIQINPSDSHTSLDLDLLPVDIRASVMSISEMASRTLEEDKSEGKLGADAIPILERLRDFKYKVSEMPRSFIDLRWSSSYAGKTMTYSIDFSDVDLYLHAEFKGNEIYIDLSDTSDFGFVTAQYDGKTLAATYRQSIAPRAIGEDEALELLHSAIDTAQQIAIMSRNKPPKPLTAFLDKLNSIAAGGFSSFNAVQPKANAPGGT